MSTPSPLPPDHADRLERVRLSLDGLSLGDALGSQFFLPSNGKLLFGPRRQTPPPVWPWTDDTAMALSIVETLTEHGHINQDDLVRRFAARYDDDGYRGYGPGTVVMLARVLEGMPWRESAQAGFDGQGSLGNGAAMRIPPLGAYFADDLDMVCREAIAASEVTHCHPEGIAGGVAVAISAAMAWRLRDRLDDPNARAELWDAVLSYTPEGHVRQGLVAAQALASDELPDAAAQLLGNGSHVRADDTVPLVVWLSVRHLHHFTESIWQTIHAGGDIDTTSAMVGGIVILANGREAIPPDWLAAREPLSGFRATDFFE